MVKFPVIRSGSLATYFHSLHCEREANSGKKLLNYEVIRERTKHSNGQNFAHNIQDFHKILFPLFIMRK